MKTQFTQILKILKILSVHVVLRLFLSFLRASYISWSFTLILSVKGRDIILDW